VYNTSSKPIKILYVHHTFRNQSYNSLLRNIANRLDKERYSLFAVCLREGGPFEYLLGNAGLHVTNLGLKSLLDPRIIPRLTRFIQQNQFDIVQTAVFPADVYGRISARLAKVPVILSVMHRTDDHKQEATYRALFFADTLTMRLTTKIIAVSQAVKNYIISLHKVNSQKIEVIHNGIDTHQYNCMVAKDRFKMLLNLKPDTPTVGFIGRIVNVKGLQYFLKAAARIIAAGKTAQFLVVGDGPLKNHFMDEARRLGLDPYVSFLGFREDIPKIMSALDVLVVPSIKEGLPLIVLEAMAAGKPIVATTVGGIPEAITHGETGILVPPREPTRIADAVMDLLNDPVKCERMGEKGKKRAREHFDIARMVADYDHLYRQCIAALAESKSL